MSLKPLVRLVACSLFCVPVLASAEGSSSEKGDDPGELRLPAEFHPGGGGFEIGESPFRLRLLAYIQAQANVHDNALERDASRDFSVRRARVNFLADFYEDFEFFLELDGAPEQRTAMVEARLNWQLMDEALQLRAGKFTSQFSTENARSSRDIDTIERFLALNSMFLLPALDTQFGVMLHGRPEGAPYSYSLGLYNGNSSANANLRDDNDSKEVQARLTWHWSEQLSTSLALNRSREREQDLRLVDAGFHPFVSVPVDGNREGLGADIHWQDGPWSLRAEGLYFRFNGREQRPARLRGGFLQPAWFVQGGTEGGTQLLLRVETAHLDGETGEAGNRLDALTAGVNWFVNPNVRLQTNLITSRFNGDSPEQGFRGSRTRPSLLSQLQFKF